MRLKKIDPLILDDHYRLNDNDNCYYLMEYYSDNVKPLKSESQQKQRVMTYSLVNNLKKLPSLKYRNPIVYKYKEKAIDEVIEYFKSAIPKRYFSACVTFIPIPSSKMKSNEEYDDRMPLIVKGITKESEADYRELIYRSESIEPSRQTSTRLSPDGHMQYLSVSKELSVPEPKMAFLFDDVIVTGSTYIACKRLLQKHFPSIKICGLFIARRIIHKSN